MSASGETSRKPFRCVCPPFSHLIFLGLFTSLHIHSFYLGRTPPTFGHQTAHDAIVKDGLTDVANQFPMGNCAEKTAKDLQITREDQDAYAIESYKRAADAWKAGAFKDEVTPVVIKDKKGDVTVSEDEEFKNIKLDKVSSLRPVFAKDGTVTAANASTLNDGASAVILASKAEADKLDAKPLARIIGMCGRWGWVEPKHIDTRCADIR